MTYFLSWVNGVCRMCNAKDLEDAKTEAQEAADVTQIRLSLLDEKLRVLHSFVPRTTAA